MPGNKLRVGREYCAVFCLCSVENKPSVPLVVNPELFTRTNIWSSTADGRTTKSLLIIAVQTSLQAFYIIYLCVSHIRSTEVTQTGTMFNTTLSLSRQEWKTWIQAGPCTHQKNWSSEANEDTVAVAEVGAVWCVFVSYLEVLMYSILVSTAVEKLLTNEWHWDLKNHPGEKIFRDQISEFLCHRPLVPQRGFRSAQCSHLGPAWYRHLFHSPQEVNVEEESLAHKNPKEPRRLLKGKIRS